MKNIALIISTMKGGGAEKVVSLLSMELAKKHNVYIILFDASDIAYNYGGNLINLNIKAEKSIFLKSINIFKRVHYLKKIKRKYKIDFSLSFMESANIPNVLSRTNDKVVVSIHSHISKQETNYLNKKTKKIVGNIYKKSDKVICASKGVAKDVINEYNLKENLVGYIYNPSDVEFVANMSKESNFEKDLFKKGQFTLIHVGRLTYAKGQWHLIRALSYVKKEIPNIKLIILGEGELKDYLLKLAHDLDLEENVLFLGYKNNPFKYIRKSDLFVLSSLYEGFGNVLVEAMVTGIPIISTDCKSGPREILAPNTNNEIESKEITYEKYGVLIPVCDGNYYNSTDSLTKEETILANSIIEMFYNETSRKKYNLKNLERSKDFDIKEIIKEWEILIN